MITNQQAFAEAKKYIAGGVNSPVRSFKNIDNQPVFIQKAHGCTLTDIEGNRYTDYCLSWGVGILGHAPQAVIEKVAAALYNGTSYGAPTLLETELAQLICQAIPSVQQLRFVSSGTEAVMSALRLARAYTKRNIIVKFNGCYHGHADYLLVSAGSGLATHNNAASLGVPPDFTKHTISIPYNNFEAVENVFLKHENDIAALIIEPIPANMGVVLPQPGFLELIRKLCTNHGALLVFDEVITGFRFCYGGYQNICNITPDLTTLGKIIGGGFPVGAYGGRHDIMQLVSPMGGVYQAGTLSGNPIAVTAGIETLKQLKNPDFYTELNEKAACFNYQLSNLAHKYQVNANTYHSMFTLFFNKSKVETFEMAKQANNTHFAHFYRSMLNKGIYLAPAQLEANFICSQHSDEHLQKLLFEIENYLKFLLT